MQQNGKCIEVTDMLFNKHIISAGYMWFFTSREDNFMKVDMSTWKAEYVWSRNTEKNFKIKTNRGIDSIACVNGNIYWINYESNEVYKYDIFGQMCKRISLEYDASENLNFVSFVEWKEDLYLISIKNGVIYKIENETDRVSKIDKIKNILDSEERFVKVCLIEGMLWLFTEKGRKVVTYQPDTEEYECLLMPQGLEGCVDVEYEDGCFWILDIQNRVWKWNLKSGIVQCMWNEISKVENAFINITVTPNRIYLLPAQEKEIFVLDKQSGEKNIYNRYPEDFQYVGCPDWCKYFGYSDYEHIRYFSMRSGNYILCVNLKSGELNWIKVAAPTRAEKWDYDVREKQRQVFCEAESLLSLLITNPCSNLKEKKDRIDIGKEIYNLI